MERRAVARQVFSSVIYWTWLVPLRCLIWPADHRYAPRFETLQGFSLPGSEAIKPAGNVCLSHHGLCSLLWSACCLACNSSYGLAELQDRRSLIISLLQKTTKTAAPLHPASHYKTLCNTKHTHTHSEESRLRKLLSRSCSGCSFDKRWGECVCWCVFVCSIGSGKPPINFGCCVG